MTESWTDERVSDLRRLWKDGLSITQIGARIGVSRNAVAGKAMRLGLPARGEYAARTKRARRPQIVGKLSAASFPSRGQCEWPLWPHKAKPGHPKYGTFCCKATEEGATYCAEHAVIAYDRKVDLPEAAE